MSEATDRQLDDSADTEGADGGTEGPEGFRSAKEVASRPAGSGRAPRARKDSTRSTDREQKDRRPGGGGGGGGGGI